jgi:hypothetical protein
MKHAELAIVHGPEGQNHATPFDPAAVERGAFDDLVLECSLPPVLVRLCDHATHRSPRAAAEGTLLTELQCEV